MSKLNKTETHFKPKRKAGKPGKPGFKLYALERSWEMGRGGGGGRVRRRLKLKL